MPELLAARAERTLSAADVDRLTRHMQRCRRCPGMADRFRAGELAYREAPELSLPEPVAERLFEALAGAAPVIGGPSHPDGPSHPLGEPGDPSEPPGADPLHEPAPPYPHPAPALAGAEAGESGMGMAQERIAAPDGPPNGSGTLSADHVEGGPVHPGAYDEESGLGFREPAREVGPPARVRAGGNGYARPILVGRRSGWGWRWALPAGVLAAALAAALALAGVFSASSSRAPRRPASPNAVPAGGTAAPATGGVPAPAGPVSHRHRHRHHHRRTHTTAGALSRAHRHTTGHRHTATHRHTHTGTHSGATGPPKP
jgi:hypothetical protein